MNKDSIEIIIQNEQVAERRIQYACEVIKKTLPAGPVLITLGREKRTLDQNKKMWAMLNDVSKQVIWYDNKLSTNSWKNMFSAGLFNQKTVPGIEGGFVVIGVSTSQLKKRPFAELIEYIYAFGTNNSVQWSEKSEDLIKEYMDWLNKERSKEARAA